MLIVTTAVAEDKAGCLVGFHTQASIEPPRFLVCISRRNHTFSLAERSNVLAVHLLSESNKALARLFGERSGDTTDKFDACSWRLHHGVPVLSDIACWFIGRVVQRTRFGDHTGHLLEPLEVHCRDDQRQLGFQEVKGMKPGHPA